jgi:hypothetical protein
MTRLTIIAVAALAMGWGTSSIAAPYASDGGLKNSPPSIVEQVQFWGGGRCARLRRACENKYERREEGQGNCRRYRAECGGR